MAELSPMASRRRDCVILLHPSAPLAGVSIGAERGCQWDDRTLADCWTGLWIDAVEVQDVERLHAVAESSVILLALSLHHY